MEVITDEIAERGLRRKALALWILSGALVAVTIGSILFTAESVACTSYGRFPGDDRSTRTDCRQQIPLYQD